MTTMRRDPLVDDYLRRLDAAAGGLPPTAGELAGELRSTSTQARARRARATRRPCATCSTASAPPEEIAAAARAACDRALERGWLETAALIVLSVSFLLPVAGYLIGAGLVLASKGWSGRDKTIVLPTPLVRSRPRRGAGRGHGLGERRRLDDRRRRRRGRLRARAAGARGTRRHRPLRLHGRGLPRHAVAAPTAVRRRMRSSLVLGIPATVAVARQHVEVAVRALGDVAQAADVLEQRLGAAHLTSVPGRGCRPGPTRLRGRCAGSARRRRRRRSARA